jgi:hypothetical protein
MNDEGKVFLGVGGTYRKESLVFKEVATLEVFRVKMRIYAEDSLDEAMMFKRGWLHKQSGGSYYWVCLPDPEHIDHVSFLINTPHRICNSPFKSPLTP